MTETCGTCRWWVAPQEPPYPFLTSKFGICRHFANDEFVWMDTPGMRAPMRRPLQPTVEHACSEHQPITPPETTP
jgi:hypothetical protein